MNTVATLLGEYWPFATGPGSNVTEAQWRRLEGNRVLGPGQGVMRGVQSEFKVIQRAAGANMSVDVGGGEVRLVGHVGYQNGGVSALNVGIAANGSGNPRKDRVVLRADFVNKQIVLDVLTGTPAVSPTVPALTQTTALWEISLATIAVASGAGSIVTANITDERLWANGIRWFLKWAISGSQALASGSTNFIIPALFELEGGWTALIDRASYAIRGGTSAVLKFQASASLAGALADITGLTALTATTTPALTQLATAGGEVAIADQVMVAPLLTAVTGSPDSLYAGISGWKYPTPLVA